MGGLRGLVHPPANLDPFTGVRHFHPGLGRDRAQLGPNYVPARLCSPDIVITAVQKIVGI